MPLSFLLLSQKKPLREWDEMVRPIYIMAEYALAFKWSKYELSSLLRPSSIPHPRNELLFGGESFTNLADCFCSSYVSRVINTVHVAWLW